MPGDLLVKQLDSEAELLRCVDLLRAAFASVAKDFGFTEESAPTNAAFTTLENLQANLRGGLALYGLFLESSLIGCVAIKKSKADGTVFYIERLAVLPEKRHSGHGRFLMQFALNTIRQLGGRIASIGVIDDNARLKAWYLLQGFRQHDCRRFEHLPFRVCFMSKDLCREAVT